MSKKCYGFLYFVLISWSLCVGLFNTQYLQINENSFSSSGYLNAPPPPPPPLEPVYRLPLSPVEYMVDLSNDLAYRLLHYHSMLNRNNFAFSPTALMSMLTAVNEGATGRSSLELRNVLWLPQDQDIIRIGYRDINRRLRTYFFGSENPLKGLSLNRGNVTVKRNYETVLMFYGYDLIEDMISSTTVPLNTTSAVLNTMKFTTEADRNPSTTLDSVNLETPATTQNQTGKNSMEETPPATTNIPTTTETSNPEKDTEISSVKKITLTSENMPTTTIPPTTTTSTQISTSTLETPTTKAKTDTNEDAAEVISSFVAEETAAEPFLRIQKARVTQLIPSGRLQAPKYLPSARRTRKRLRRNKRHLFDTDASLLVTLIQPQSPISPQYHQRLYPISELDSESLITAALHNTYEANIGPNFLNTIPTANAEPPRQDYDTDIISHVFHLNSHQTIHTTFKVYNAVLYHKYFDQQKISALELELNTPEYNLVLLLPDFGADLTATAASLHLGPTLRLMRKQLKPRWVQAIIPDFNLHGTIFLTNDLQNMGICDIFEPNRADLRPMTDEKGVYIKHIEQSINVNIRTRPINQLKQSSSSQTQPIQLSVNRPFLFFIIDRDLDVAVMAGRILNPLNVRIQ